MGLPRSTLLQSYDYARFLQITRGMTPHFGQIRRGSGEVVGMFQVITHTVLGGRVGAVILDRGPLWFEASPPREWIIGFFKELGHLYPAGILRRRRVIPEVPAGLLTRGDWQDAGFRRVASSAPYQTAWLDLTGTPGEWHQRFDKNWRYDLKRAEQNNLSDPVFSGHADAARALIGLAACDQKTRHYRGLSEPDITRLVHICAQGDGIIAASIHDQGSFLAGAIFLRHGSCATYQTGAISAQGRALRANHLLLWRSFSHLQRCGVTALDLGGYNGHDAKGIAHFKKGLGGDHVTLDGHYR